MEPPNTLHEQHLEFVDLVETIRRVADVVGLVPLNELREQICGAYNGLTRELIPHAMAEDQSPLAQVTGKPADCRAMVDALTREHLEMGQLAEELDALRWELAYPTISVAQEQALRRVLYGLYALMKVHLVGAQRCICEETLPPEEEAVLVVPDHPGTSQMGD